ncbi:predicted protein [Uncinocarpus reesii 1704]|uniref:Reverse transcriptase domain-containing protein n=1 Tax=Uncinocarpus reesii (strain UAMH 1704) TaxID=336963 RepID=C4JH21_UNCRE|nr:uncharacterized protein UREG_01272 [Uncinocarpus reesii 1704]EEP76423.1 predicted protein [Uncinocarpus reesii 1704]
MAAQNSVLSQTLQALTTTKIEELEKQRQTYEAAKNKILASARDAGDDIRERIARLYKGALELQLLQEFELQNMVRWLDQSRYDPTVPESMLVSFETELRSSLDRHTRKLDLADLYSRLLIEWVSSPGSNEPEPELLEEGEAFDIVQDIQKEKLQQLRERFEKVVFEPLITDEMEIVEYLESLFAGDDRQQALKHIRSRVSDYGESLFNTNPLVTRPELKACIKSLLRNDLLNDEKSATLTEFLRDDTVLDEIANVLNLRYANLANWTWNLGDNGMPVEPWCVFLKRRLQGLIRNATVWSKGQAISERDLALRRYYLQESKTPGEPSLDEERFEVYNEHFFLAPMATREFEDASGYDDDDNVNDDDDDNDNMSDTGKLSPKETKQLLLRSLATEVLFGRAFDGEVAVVQSDFQWFATGIAHSTVFAVLRFIGLPEKWIEFFKKVLEPPLDMLTGEPVRIRKRGLPMVHIFEKVFGELVLFFMDMAVNQQANMLLYRIHDDLWLCGKPDKCAKAWQAMEQFAKVMGLEFNQSKTGSTYLVGEGQQRNLDVVKALPKGPVVVNFLVLDPTTGEWVVNQNHVKQHVEQLSKQLNAANSVLQWVKTWNTCIGRFFSYTFGEPADCFGRKHLNAILATHQTIQRTLFNGLNGNGSNVVEHVKKMIASRFNVTDIPDAFLYMPEALGGIGLHNPFVPLSLVSPNICEDPGELIHEFLQNERETYRLAKRNFEELSETNRRRRFQQIFPKDEETGIRLHAPSRDEAKEFLPFHKYVEMRGYNNPKLLKLFRQLNLAAKMRKLNSSHEIIQELRKVSRSLIHQPELSVSKIDPELEWLMQFHLRELKEKCGGLSIVDRSFLPLGILKAMRRKKVAWRMAL